MALEILTKRNHALYGITFLLGTFLMIGLLFINGWNISTLLSADYMLFLFSISGITMKILSGIGIMLTYNDIQAILRSDEG